jgi:hypothetical protein
MDMHTVTKVVGVFVRFRAPLHPYIGGITAKNEATVNIMMETANNCVFNLL